VSGVMRQKPGPCGYCRISVSLQKKLRWYRFHWYLSVLYLRIKKWKFFFFGGLLNYA